ncbi:MAG: hypothetical protein ACI94Y_003763 [Maribacter sp.]|jgi:hypothetical protein
MLQIGVANCGERRKILRLYIWDRYFKLAEYFKPTKPLLTFAAMELFCIPDGYQYQIKIS